MAVENEPLYAEWETAALRLAEAIALYRQAIGSPEAPMRRKDMEKAREDYDRVAEMIE